MCGSIIPSSLVEYDLVVLELLCLWAPPGPATPATPAPLVMSGLGVTESKPGSFLRPESKKSSSSSSSRFLLHLKNKRMSPAISATPAIDPITTPAMPPPDNVLPDPELLLSLDAVLESSGLMVVVTSIMDALDVPLDEPVTVDTNVVITPDSEEDDGSEELASWVEGEDVLSLARLDVAVEEATEELELDSLDEVRLVDSFDRVSDDDDDDDRLDDRVRDTMVEPSTSSLT